MTAFMVFPVLPGAIRVTPTLIDVEARVRRLEQTGVANHLQDHDQYGRHSEQKGGGDVQQDTILVVLETSGTVSVFPVHTIVLGRRWRRLTSMCHLSPLHAARVVKSRPERKTMGSRDCKTSRSIRSKTERRQASVTPLAMYRPSGDGVAEAPAASINKINKLAPFALFDCSRALAFNMPPAIDG